MNKPRRTQFLLVQESAQPVAISGLIDEDRVAA
jgi:hypothetical protein